MADPTILFVKPKAISQRDKKALREAGVVVVELDEPHNAKFVRAGAELTGSEMLNVAMHLKIEQRIRRVWPSDGPDAACEGAAPR